MPNKYSQPRKLKNFLIMPRYQMEHVLFTTAAICLGMGIVGYYFFYNQIIITSMILDLGGDESTVQKINNESVVFFFITLIAIILFYGTLNIILTHRVFGPIFAVERYLKQILNGETPAPIHSRHNNHTAQLVDLVRKAGERIQELEKR